jgi:hypothetical protein
MKDAHHLPILIHESGHGILLERIPLTVTTGLEAYDEAWLQKLLFEHPEAIPVAEINDTFSGLIPICRELSTPAGPIDILYATKSGRIALLEAKLWRNPEARRKVIGQILDYAKEISHWTYERLDATVRAATRRDTGTARSLVEIVGGGSDGFDEASFIDAVSRNLRRGDLLLLIAGDGIRENVGAIANFIEDHGTLHFTFGLVEMAIYRMPDRSILIHPRVLAQSAIVRRIVVELRDNQLGEPEADPIMEYAVPENSAELEEKRRVFGSFWADLIREHSLDDSSQPLRNPSNWTNQRYDMPPGSDGWISAAIALKAESVGVYINFRRSPIGDRIYSILAESSAEIESEIGGSNPLKWFSSRSGQGAEVWRNFGPNILTENSTEAKAWLGDLVNRFVNAFRPRIESILRGD